MEQNQSKCEYCGTSYKVKKPAESSYDEVLRNEAGEAVKWLNFEPRFMGESISREDYREKQREIFQRGTIEGLVKEEKQMSLNEIIGSDEEDTSTFALVRYCIGGTGITLAIFAIIYIIFIY